MDARLLASDPLDNALVEVDPSIKLLDRARQIDSGDEERAPLAPLPFVAHVAQGLQGVRTALGDRSLPAIRPRSSMPCSNRHFNDYPSK